MRSRKGYYLVWAGDGSLFKKQIVYAESYGQAVDIYRDKYISKRDQSYVTANFYHVEFICDKESVLTE